MKDLNAIALCHIIFRGLFFCTTAFPAETGFLPAVYLTSGSCPRLSPLRSSLSLDLENVCNSLKKRFVSIPNHGLRRRSCRTNRSWRFAEGPARYPRRGLASQGSQRGRRPEEQSEISIRFSFHSAFFHKHSRKLT